MSITVEIELEAIQCAHCGVVFGLSSDYAQRRRQDHQGFYCPFGHSNYYYQKSEAEKLRERLGEEQAKLANAQMELMLSGKKIRRLEKQAKNGKCPCCHRQFVNMARHMKSKHPGFAE